MEILSKIESILFVAGKPLSVAKLAKALGLDKSETLGSVGQLTEKYNREGSGIHIFVENEIIRMGTNPENGELIKGFVKDEAEGELTKAQLETLTVIAYRGPITRPELEEIRGVNCAVILRNLLIKGLAHENQDDNKLAMVYTISLDALSHLGVNSVEQLPDYTNLSVHENLENTLSKS